MKGLLALTVFGLLCAASLRAQQPVAAQGCGVTGTSDAAWTSSTSLNSTVALISNSAVYNSIQVTLVQGSTITGGVVTFQQSNDNSHWTSVQGVSLGTSTIMGPTYTLAASTTVTLVFPVTGPYFQVLLSTAITGSGTVTVQHYSQCFPMVGLLAGSETLAAGNNVIGHVIADSGSTIAVTGNVAVTAADGAETTLGAKADAKNTATDTTAISLMAAIKEISAMEQTPASRAVTNATGANLETAPVTTATTTDTALRCTLVSAASTNATVCKASAGNVYGFRFVNTTATLYYLRMYNLTSGPTCSSATGFVESIPIPASATGAGIVAIEPMGEGYSTGISFCFTGGGSSTDNTNAATGVFGTVLYK